MSWSFTTDSAKAKVLGAKWRNADDKIKSGWAAKAEEAKIQHQAMYPGYTYKPRKPSEKKRRNIKKSKRAQREQSEATAAPQQRAPEVVETIVNPDSIPSTPIIAAAPPRPAPSAPLASPSTISFPSRQEPPTTPINSFFNVNMDLDIPGSASHDVQPTVAKDTQSGFLNDEAFARMLQEYNSPGTYNPAALHKELNGPLLYDNNPDTILFDKTAASTFGATDNFALDNASMPASSTVDSFTASAPLPEPHFDFEPFYTAMPGFTSDTANENSNGDSNDHADITTMSENAPSLFAEDINLEPLPTSDMAEDSVCDKMPAESLFGDMDEDDYVDTIEQMPVPCATQPDSASVSDLDETDDEPANKTTTKSNPPTPAVDFHPSQISTSNIRDARSATTTTIHPIPRAPTVVSNFADVFGPDEPEDNVPIEPDADPFATAANQDCDDGSCPMDLWVNDWTNPDAWY